MTIRQRQLLLACGSMFFVMSFALACGRSVRAQCRYTLPHGPAAVLDLEQAGTLSFTKDIRVINVYWGGNNWNGIPANKNFKKEDIDSATRALFFTDYFEKLCQYGGPSGGPRVTLLPSTDTGQALNPCLPHAPNNNFTTADVFNFVACEEGFEFTDVPHAHGIPTELIPGVTGPACTLCGLTAQPCYADGACLLFPNSTGDLIINVIPPRDKHFFANGQDCPMPGKSGMSGFHFQVPSNAFGYPFFPLLLTQARPIYFTFVRTECFQTIDQMMATLSHELVEALSDPLPGAFWYDQSHGQTGANGENADICKRLTKNGDYDPAGGLRAPPILPWTDSKGVSHSMEVAHWWSNYDHDCIAPLNPRTPPPPGPPSERCQRIAAAIERLRESVQRLDEELNDATGQERTILQKRIRTANQQIKREEEALARCQAGNPPAPPRPSERCQRIAATIERLRENVQRLEEELNDATGQERTVLQKRIRTEEEALARNLCKI